jgi:hypothetical protein
VGSVSPKLQGALVLVAVFALGTVTGGGVVFYAAQHRIHSLLDKSPGEARREAIVGMMRRRLNLEGRQVDAVRGILIGHEAEFREIHRTIAPQMGELRKHVFAEVRGVLREDQLPQLDRLAAHWEKWTRPDDAPPPSAGTGLP